jgi:uncharacterized protein (TIGR03435 family)
MRTIGCIALLCGLSHAQTSVRPKVEVASLKSSGPISGYPARRISGGPGTASPGQISYFQQSLKDLVFMAYRVQFFRLDTPDWMEHTYFDIAAKLPAGATKDDLPMMLQDLLAERLKVRIRRDTKDMPGYLLTIGPNGPKLKPSPDGASPAAAPPESGKGPRFALDKDGFIVAPLGVANMLTLPGKDGIIRLTGARATMDVLSGYLSRQLQRPVLNQTGLEGIYDFHLVFAPTDVTAPSSFEQPEAGSGTEGTIPQAAAPAPTLFKAVESQLGLKMLARNVPADLLIVEHAERVPAEN